MARNTIPEFSTDDDSNTDIGGIGLTANDSAGNLVKAFRKNMSILKKTSDGTAPLDDTFRVRNADDTTKQVGFDAENVPPGTSRALDAEGIYQGLLRNFAAKETIYGTVGTFTHSLSDFTKFFQIEAVGGGGGGGGVDGQGTTTSGAGGGGSTGFYGYSDLIPKGSIITATVVVGSGGAGGVSSNDGGPGADTTWNDGTNLMIFTGGDSGKGVVAVTSGKCGAGGSGAGIASTLVHGACTPGGFGIASSSGQAISGQGGTNPFGGGGQSVLISNGTSAGNNGRGRGAGGSGGVASDTSANANGGTGTPGLLIVREW